MRSSMKTVTALFLFALIYVLSVLIFQTKWLHRSLPQEHEQYQRWEVHRPTTTRSSAQSQTQPGVETQEWSSSVLRKANNRGASSSGHSPSTGVRAPAEPRTTGAVKTAANSNIENKSDTKISSNTSDTKISSNTSDTKISSKAETLSAQYPWLISDASRHPREVHHVVFVKVHKAASTTMFSIMVRFALSRQLDVMFPKHGHIIKQNGSRLRPLAQNPFSPSFLFDILCNHVVFKHDLVRPYFPADTKYIAIIRDPFQQVKSAFFYYRYVFHRPYLRSVNSWEQFIQNQARFEPKSPYMSFTNNRMSIDLGLEPRLLKHPVYVNSFLEHLDNVFHLVLIADRFDESLLLLKRRFHWTMKDIVYMNLNTGKKKDLNIKEINREAMKRFKRFQLFDVAVYEHFLKIFDQEVAEEGQDFNDELACYVSTQKQIKDFCSSANTSATELLLPSSKWDRQLTFLRSECKILTVGETALNSWARSVQLARQG